MASLAHILRDPEPQDGAPAATTPPSAATARPSSAAAPSAHDHFADAAMPPRRKQPEHPDDDSNSVATPRADASKGEDGDEPPLYTSITTSTRRNASGATSSVYSGNKIRHLKKEDGIPLWRRDIQYEFLKLVFYDETKCFTKASNGSTGHTFADIYIDAMAKSSKCSKILKEKLLQDREGAASMAMVCLLVNVGRMNTTLNFFPEMRAQLRTYHSIPALQAHQDPTAYKQLQDAPRLKSILKGATEDEPQPNTMDDIKAASIPRTNPVNLIFVMSQYAPKISELHFPSPRDFFDLVMRPTLSSSSRARAFLWLVWWYLESDFSAEDSQRNPFGAGLYGEGEEGTGALPLRVPTLESLTEEQAELENVDTEEEKHFGEVKRKERIAILASEPSAAMTALKRARKEKGLTTGHNAQPSDDEGSDAGYPRGVLSSAVGRSGLHETDTRSPSPAASRGFQAVNTKLAGDMRINNLLNDDGGPDSSPTHAASTPSAPPPRKGPGRGNWRRSKKADATTPAGARTAQEGSHHVPLLPNTGQLSFVNEGPQLQMATPGSSNGNKAIIPAGMSPNQVTNISFQAPATRDHIPTPSYQAQKRHRGVTQHQSAVINHRKLQIEYLLDKGIRRVHVTARRKREDHGIFIRAWKRIRSMPPDYDSEEEAIKIRKARDRADKNDDIVHRGKDNDDYLGNVDLWRRPRVLHAGFVRTPQEPTDVGEEAKTLAQSFRRCSRRLEKWTETDLPGQAMMRRNEMDQEPRRKSRRSIPGMDKDGSEFADAASSSRAGRQRQRSGYELASEKREAEAEAEPDDEDGGAELDEEDRELLGEVDADESDEEGEDVDEDMDD